MNIFKRILGEISGKNLTTLEGKPPVFETREVSTGSIREMETSLMIKIIKKALLLEGLFASVELSFNEESSWISSPITGEEIIHQNNKIVKSSGAAGEIRTPSCWVTIRALHYQSFGGRRLPEQYLLYIYV